MARDLLTALDNARLENLKAQLSLLQSGSPFYEGKLKGIDPAGLSSLSDISDLPFTTNDEVKAAGPFGVLMRNAKPEAYYQSSGTTGQPTSGFPDLSADKAASFGAFLDQWMGLRNARVDKALICLAYEMNPTGIRFQMALPYAGVTVIPAGVRSTICPPDTVLDLIQTLEPQALFSRPFEVLRIGDAMKARGVDPADSSILKVFMLGEPISRRKWHRIAELWGDADLYAHYGLTEIDTGLQTCSEGWYHEPPSPFAHFYLIDNSLKTIGEADTCGEIVASVLKRAHAPLLNYRTGDIGIRLAGPCGCGQPTPRYRVIGRESDAVTIGEVRVHPVDIENEVYANRDIGNEYQFQVLEGERLNLILERAYGSNADLGRLAKEVIAHLHAELSIDATVEVRPFGEIADKLGIAKKKSARFTDLRGLEPDALANEQKINVIDSNDLKTGAGVAISI